MDRRNSFPGASRGGNHDRPSLSVTGAFAFALAFTSTTATIAIVLSGRFGLGNTGAGGGVIGTMRLAEADCALVSLLTGAIATTASLECRTELAAFPIILVLVIDDVTGTTLVTTCACFRTRAAAVVRGKSLRRWRVKIRTDRGIASNSVRLIGKFGYHHEGWPFKFFVPPVTVLEKSSKDAVPRPQRVETA